MVIKLEVVYMFKLVTTSEEFLLFREIWEKAAMSENQSAFI
jgi:hypothetical protein